MNEMHSISFMPIRQSGRFPGSVSHPPGLGCTQDRGTASRGDCDRMELWFNLIEQGFKTTPEAPEPTRSDCHGWGAHPLYHDFASLLGIDGKNRRPAAFGFERVEIAPIPRNKNSEGGCRACREAWFTHGARLRRLRNKNSGWNSRPVMFVGACRCPRASRGYFALREKALI